MARSIITAGLVALALTAALVSGCDGDDDGDKTGTVGDSKEARDAERRARREVARRIREDVRRRRRGAKGDKGASGKPPTLAERGARIRRTRRRAAARERRERAEDRRFDREFDRGFRESGFDRLVGKLPIRRPPLYVQQYITSSGSHRVYTAVSRRRFLCRMTPAQRRRAIARFFRSADRVMRAGGVDDFVQIVTLTSQRTQKLPALARARRGSVTLTGDGRKRNPC